VPKKRKKSEKETQEYLLLNYPQDVRKNLKGLTLPEDEFMPTANKNKEEKAATTFKSTTTTPKSTKKGSANEERAAVTDICRQC
jgi:hypothetical protein